jgi:hypothetical protein
VDGGDEDRRISVSPRHHVLLAREYVALVERAPKRDFVVRTLMRRQVGDLLLMTAELVIAGEETRALHPLSVAYPLHFRKTYFPGQLHDDPQVELDNYALASRLTSLPPPIGCTANVFRSCLIPGTPYARLSPFGVDPPEMNVPLAEKLPLASAAGLWLLAEQALAQLLTLQQGGLAHGDAELHNCIVCPSPLELLFIDFGSSVHRAAVDEAAWEVRCARDLEPILREAVLLQCALGRQVGRLADLSWERMDRLLPSADRFRRVIERQAAHDAGSSSPSPGA